MAIGNRGLPLNVHNAQTRDLRNRLNKDAMSDLRSWRFEQSDGIRPAEYMAAYKHLPVTLKDTNTEDYVVIPKGRIVSALSHLDTAPSGIPTPSASGSIETGFAATEMGGAAIVSDVNSFYGYDENIVSLLTLANGGTLVSGFYTADDVSAQTIMANATVVASGGTPVEFAANAPIGVAFHDIYQDIRGANLNYQMHPVGQSVLTDYYVEVPFVNAASSLSASGANPTFVNNDYANLVKYWNINKSFSYLGISDGETLRNGLFVQPDLLGNYKLQAAPSGFTVYNQPKTPQTVGKILALDTRFPKGGLEDVQTYNRSGMPGTQTAGLPKVLFDFAYYTLLAKNGTAPTVEAIYNACTNGTFGLARIQLLVS